MVNDGSLHQINMFLIVILAFISLTMVAASTIYSLLIYYNSPLPKSGIRFFVMKYIFKNFGLGAAIISGITFMPVHHYWLIIFFPLLADLLVNMPLVLVIQKRKKEQHRRIYELEQIHGKIEA